MLKAIQTGGAGGGGDVVGPSSAVDSQITLFNGTTGKLLKAATTTGMLKASSGVIAAATAGTDYAAAPTGTNTQLLANNGTGGFANVTVGSGLSLAAGTLSASGTGDVVGPSSSVDSQIALFNSTTGKLIKAATTTGLLKASSGVIAAASAGTDYAPATSGTSILKGNGTGGFSNASAGTDYAPATSGTSILYGNGSGGFSNVTVGTGLSFAAGTLSATGGGGGFSPVTAAMIFG